MDSVCDAANVHTYVSNLVTVGVRGPRQSHNALLLSSENQCSTHITEHNSHLYTSLYNHIVFLHMPPVTPRLLPP